VIGAGADQNCLDERAQLGGLAGSRRARPAELSANPVATNTSFTA
jgi:hypothetical protein